MLSTAGEAWEQAPAARQCTGGARADASGAHSTRVGTGLLLSDRTPSLEGGDTVVTTSTAGVCVRNLTAAGKEASLPIASNDSDIRVRLAVGTGPLHTEHSPERTRSGTPEIMSLRFGTFSCRLVLCAPAVACVKSAAGKADVGAAVGKGGEQGAPCKVTPTRPSREGEAKHRGKPPTRINCTMGAQTSAAKVGSPPLPFHRHPVPPRPSPRPDSASPSPYTP